MLDGLPLGGLVTVAALVLIVTFFVTSSDSGSLVIDMLASGGNTNPPVWSRVMWAVLEGLVAAALLLVGAVTGLDGGLAALQTTAIVIALPFSFVMVLMMVATLRAFRSESAEVDAERRRLGQRRLTSDVAADLRLGRWPRRARNRRAHRCDHRAPTDATTDATGTAGDAPSAVGPEPVGRP